MSLFSLIPLVFIRQGAPIDFNGTNNLFRIVMMSEAPLGAAVLGQEVCEHEMKLALLLVGLLAAAAGVWFGLVPAEFWPIMGIPAMLLTLLWNVGPLHRHLELTGHAVECAIAARYYGRDLDQYEKREGAGMQPQSGYPFRSMSVDQVVAGLVRRRGIARTWIALHGWLIRRAMKRWPAN